MNSNGPVPVAIHRMNAKFSDVAYSGALSEVQALISSGARPHPDLTAALDSALLQPLVYELE